MVSADSEIAQVDHKICFREDYSAWCGDHGVNQQGFVTRKPVTLESVVRQGRCRTRSNNNLRHDDYLYGNTRYRQKQWAMSNIQSRWI